MGNIIDLFGKNSIYPWKIEDGRLVVHVSFYFADKDEPATPKSGRRGKRKRAPSVQSEDDAVQSEGFDEVQLEGDAAQVEGTIERPPSIPRRTPRTVRLVVAFSCPYVRFSE
ncbi:hypothetical protein E4U24_000381 [Claviceps purpurea]|nr:hypothetical protein E4U24_000381 [Claviceps purpurea]